MAKRKSKPYVARRRNPDADDDDVSPHQLKWWLSETGYDATSKLWTWVERNRGPWSADSIGDLIHEAIYADEPIARGGRFDGQQWIGGAGGTCILNVIKSLVDTSTARLTKVRTMPCISANNASYSQKRFARQVSRVLRVKMGGQDVETASPLVIRDGNIRGTGVWKTQRNGGDTETIRIPIYEVVYDHREAQALQGGPSSLAHVRPENRDKLIARYPRFVDEIRAAPLYTKLEPWMQFVYQGPTVSDLIEVAEAWHPPSGPEADDGQHIVCIRGHCILREPWLVPRYPLTFQYWSPPVRGVRGKGLVQEHANAQNFIDRILAAAQRNIDATADLTILTQRNANVNKNHLRSGGGPRVVEADGVPGAIQFLAPDPVSKQAWAIAFQVKSEMYNVSGIAEWSATANKPLGENASGKALDTMNDNQSDRFADVETQLSQARVAIGRAHIDLAQHMYAEAHGKIDNDHDEAPDALSTKDLAAWIRDNKWDKLDLDSGDYQLTLEAINFISGTRGGKLEEAAEAAKAGLIPDPTMTAALFDEPDIARMNRPILGPFHRIEACMEGLADVDVDYMTIAPDESMNLPLAKLMAKGELEQAKADNAEDEIIARFIRFLDDIKGAEAKAAQGAGMSPSLAGAQSNTMIDQGNAATLQAGMAPPMPQGMPPQGLPPTGMMQ